MKRECECVSVMGVCMIIDVCVVFLLFYFLFFIFFFKQKTAYEI